jgi:predicted permease
MGTVRQDIRYGIRTLRDRPGFTLIATLSLALGIGVNTTVFSIVNALMLAPLGFPDEDRIVALTAFPRDAPDARSGAAYREYEAWQEAESFDAVGVVVTGVKNLGAGADGSAAEELQVIRADPSLYDVLQIKPQLGRLIAPEEDRIDNWAAVTLLSDGFWQRRFGRDPNVLGQTLRLDGVVTTIIGVMPPGLEEQLFLRDADLWVPSEIVTAQSISEGRFLNVFARLKSRTTIEQAGLELDVIARRFAEEYPNTNAEMGFKAMRMHEFFLGDARNILLILQGAVFFVLLIACANVAGLMLARAASRQTEVAIRGALGANRLRLIRQVLTESAVLSIMGGVVGIALAWVGLKIFALAAPPGLPNLQAMNLNASVLAFTAGVVIVTALAFGIMPALHGTRPDLTALLNDAGRGLSSGTTRQRLRLVLVAGQTSVAMLLLITAGLLINSFVQLQGNDLGADADRILTFRMQFSQDETITFTGEQVNGVGLWDVNPRVGQTIEQVYEALNEIPGVNEAAAVTVPPFLGAAFRNLEIDGRETDADGEQYGAAYVAATPGYFRALNISTLRGRVFDQRDRQGAQKVVVINEAMAREFWPDSDPLGSFVSFDFVPDEPPREVVGIVANVLLSLYDEDARPAVYVPYVQQTDTWLGPQWGQRAGVYFLAKGPSNPMDLVPLVRSAVARVDSDRPLTQVRTIEQYLAEQVRDDALIVGLLTTFGVIAGVLAVSGIYGVISYSVAERTHEIGIRLALGSNGPMIVRLIMRQAVIVVVTGLVIGLAGSLVLTRLIASLLFGVGATDPATFAIVAALLLATALIACFVPARRALRVHPSQVLRYG